VGLELFDVKYWHYSLSTKTCDCAQVTEISTHRCYLMEIDFAIRHLSVQVIRHLQSTK